jgi:hypothetical protein
MPDDGRGHLVLEIAALEQRAQRLDLALHLAARLLELEQDAPVAPPREHDEGAGAPADGGGEEQQRPAEGDRGEREQNGVEQQEPDGRDGEGAAGGGGLHRTGWRRAGKTMNGAFGTAPRAPSVIVSSSTWAPRNFTT